MALTQAQRIEISKKIIEVPTLNAGIDAIKASLDKEITKLDNEDGGNKSLMDDKTSLINPYQLEIAKLDGNIRTELQEQDLIDSANHTLQNFFFPNDNTVTLPSISDGVWKFLIPFSGSAAIGKKYTEDYDSTPKEQDKINSINSQISIIESIIAGTRSTGLECVIDTTGTCVGETPVGSGVDETTCLANGGTWTPNNGPDTYISSPTIQQALLDIVSAINEWKAILGEQKALIQAENIADSNTTRQSQNNAAISDIDNAISVIDSWLSYNDWDTTTSLPSGSGGSGCAAFSSMISSDFTPSKLRSTELQEIKDEITSRTSFVSTRLSQISGYLGTVGQNLSTGELTGSGSGFYDQRFKIINLRINLLGGSLSKKLSMQKGKDTQDDLKTSNNNVLDVYSGIMNVSSLKAPASNTGTIHVSDGSLFSNGDFVYIVAQDQEELSGNIVSVSGNTIFLDISVPQKYTQNNQARIYKIL